MFTNLLICLYQNFLKPVDITVLLFVSDTCSHNECIEGNYTLLVEIVF